MSPTKEIPEIEEINAIKEGIDDLQKKKKTRDQMIANLTLQIEEKKKKINGKKKGVNKQYSMGQKFINKMESIFTFKEKQTLSEIISAAKNDKELEVALARKAKEDMRGKLKKTFLILGFAAVSLIFLYIWNEHYKKNHKKVYDTEQGSVDHSNGKNTDLTLPSQSDKISAKQLQNILPKDRIDGVSYDQIVEKINTLPNTSARIKLIDFLKQGDIIGMQEFAGMKVNSEYTLNNATGVIDENTLSRITDHLVGLSGNDIINNENIPLQVREAYQEFMNGREKFNNEDFGFISKSDCKLYLFDKDGALINTQEILIGKNFGKQGERVPYPYFLGTKGEMVYHHKPVNTNTPEGYFIVQRAQGLNDDFIADGPKTALILIPIRFDPQQGRVQENRFDTRFGFGLHFVFQPKSNPDLYEDAIKSPDIPNNVSHGCINTQQNGINIDNLSVGRSIIKVTP